MPALAPLEHSLGHASRLIALVAHRHEARLRRRETLGPQILRESLAGEIDHGIRCVENRLRRSVVPVQRDDPRGRRELRRKVEDVAHRRGAKRIDRLRIVADDGHALAVRLERKEDRRLQSIGVLVFVDENVIEPLADVARQRRLRGHVRPVQKQVVVVEDVLGLLGAHIRREERLQFRGPRYAPGVGLVEHVGECRFGIDDARIDREARRFRRKPALRDVDVELLPHDGHQVLGVAAVEDRERLGKADARRIFAQQSRADAMERPGPLQRTGTRRDAAPSARCTRCVARRSISAARGART
jgi:hypothetical protein